MNHYTDIMNGRMTECSVVLEDIFLTPFIPYDGPIIGEYPFTIITTPFSGQMRLRTRMKISSTIARLFKTGYYSTKNGRKLLRKHKVSL